MTIFSILTRVWPHVPAFSGPGLRLPETLRPRFVQKCPVAKRYQALLGPLAWERFPERNLQETRGTPAVPYRTFAGAYLIKLEEGLVSMTDLHQYLCEHPALAWLVGFQTPGGPHAGRTGPFQTPLPTPRHLTRMLRNMSNPMLQFCLDETVHLLQAALPVTKTGVCFGEAISLDTKHILAWVKENNPKTYVKERYNPAHQPPGDPDCRLGAKRRRNQGLKNLPTPTQNPVSASAVSLVEYHWGYASGVVATKVPGWGEFVLAEVTQPFDCADASYFFPLMAATERRLGFRPRFAALDAAFDAFYVYAYFHRTDPPGGFAAVPLVEKGGVAHRIFDPSGLPLCSAGLPMPLKFTFVDRTRALIEHERGKYGCPLLFPTPSGQTCPLAHERWLQGGCTADMPTSIGARLRYQLPCESLAYKEIYKQRTATERINSQAVALGIERPTLRNGQAIANQNTFIYVLLNLRALQRVTAHAP